MAQGFDWSGLASTGISSGLSAWNSRNNIAMQQETNEQNYRMFKEAQEYDKPINQVQRLKDAGLNPALMYGTGSGANLSPKPIGMEAPKGDYRIDPGVAVSLQQARLIGQQASLAKEQARAAKRDNDVLDKSPGSLKSDSSLSRGVRQLWNSLFGPGTSGDRVTKDLSDSVFSPKAGKMDLLNVPAWMKMQRVPSKSRGVERAGSKF